MNGDDFLETAKKLVEMGVCLQNVMYAVLIGAGFSVLLYPFLDRKKWKAFLAGVFYTAFFAWMYFATWNLPKGCASILRIGFGFLFLYLLHPKRPRQKLFLSMLFFCIMALSLQIAVEQGMYVSDFLYSSTSLNSTPQRTIYLFFAVTLEETIVVGLLIFFGVFATRQCMFEYSEESSWRDLLFLSLPFLVVFSLMFVYSDSMDLYGKYALLLQDINDTKTLEALSFNSVSRMLSYLLLYLFVLVFLWCFFDIKKTEKEHIATAVLAEQTSMLQSHLKKMDETYKEIYAIRHDMNHHLEVLSTLVSGGKTEDVKEYLSSLEMSVYETKPLVSTGNPVTDSILSEYRKEAEKTGISFEADFFYPKEFGVDVFDLSGVLNNALSNAFEACQRDHKKEKAHIRIRSFLKGQIYVVEVSNTFSGTISVKTTKSGSGHGMGIYNMKQIAKKYGGDVTLETDGNEAVLTVIFQKK